MKDDKTPQLIVFPAGRTVPATPIPASLLVRLRTLDTAQLGIVELVVAAIQRGAR